MEASCKLPKTHFGKDAKIFRGTRGEPIRANKKDQQVEERKETQAYFLRSRTININHILSSFQVYFSRSASYKYQSYMIKYKETRELRITHIIS